MWRDRTNLFISYRQSYSHHPAKKPRYGGPASNGFRDSGGGRISEERLGLMSGGAFEDDGDAVIEMDLLPPRWLDIQDEVTEYLAEIAKQTRKLEQLHQKHVLPGFDDEEVKRREEREIENLTQEITRGFQKCQKAIQRIEMMVRDAKQQGNISNGEETMARNLKISLASRVGDVSAMFRKKQAAYLKKLRTLANLSTPTGLRSTSPNPSSYTDPALDSAQSDVSFSQSTLLASRQQRQSQLQRPSPNDALITQRETEIEQIAAGIISLAQIFQELQTMVIDQGSMLDRIDYNVERMAVDVKEADKELKVASGYQRRTVKRKIMLLLVILIVGMVILLSLKLGSKGRAPAAPINPIAPPEAETDKEVEAHAIDDLLDDALAIMQRRAPIGFRERREWQRRKRRIWRNEGGVVQRDLSGLVSL